MTTITILKETGAKKDLVAIPRKEYEVLLEVAKNIKVFKPTPAQRKALQQARREFAQGKYFTIDQLKYELGSSRRRQS